MPFCVQKREQYFSCYVNMLMWTALDKLFNVAIISRSLNIQIRKGDISFFPSRQDHWKLGNTPSDRLPPSLMQCITWTETAKVNLTNCHHKVHVTAAVCLPWSKRRPRTSAWATRRYLIMVLSTGRREHVTHCKQLINVCISENAKSSQAMYVHIIWMNQRGWMPPIILDWMGCCEVKRKDLW